VHTNDDFSFSPMEEAREGNQRLHILFFFLIEHTKGDHNRVMTLIPVIVKEDLPTSMIPSAHSIFKCRAMWSPWLQTRGGNIAPRLVNYC
jgi:hypothetical protein